jgi:DNA transposition AAA+ family ATPase
MSETSTAVVKTYPFDADIRGRLLALMESGVKQAEIVRGSRVQSAVVSQYLNKAGNLYPGDTERFERAFKSWLNRRDLELLAGIPTISTPVSEQIVSAAKMVMRCGIMGKGIGKAGIGKTRGATLLQSVEGLNAIVIFASKETGDREFIRNELYREMGIRGPQKGPKRRPMYAELVKRLKDAKPLLVIDQAHMLGKSAIDFLVELWNATRAAQLWLGTRKLADKLDRDEQWASRLDFTFELNVVVDKAAEINEVRPLVEHQVKSRLPDLNGEFKQIAGLCEKLAITGSFRRVEMRLTTMLYLSESPRNQGKRWAELFEMAGAFLNESEPEE